MSRTYMQRRHCCEERDTQRVSQHYRVDSFISATDPPLPLRCRHLVKILGVVNFESVFGRFLLFLRVPQKECGKRSSITFFRFRDAFDDFSVTFSDASVTFFVTFCQTPFAGLLLRQGEFLIEVDQKLTKNRPKIDLLQGVRWGVILRRGEGLWLK